MGFGARGQDRGAATPLGAAGHASFESDRGGRTGSVPHPAASISRCLASPLMLQSHSKPPRSGKRGGKADVVWTPVQRLRAGSAPPRTKRPGGRGLRAVGLLAAKFGGSVVGLSVVDKGADEEGRRAEEKRTSRPQSPATVVGGAPHQTRVGQRVGSSRPSGETSDHVASRARTCGAGWTTRGEQMTRALPLNRCFSAAEARRHCSRGSQAPCGALVPNAAGSLGPT